MDIGVDLKRGRHRVIACRLKRPDIGKFVTLSPVPGFARWLSSQTDAPAVALAGALAGSDWQSDPDAQARLRPGVEAMAARYIIHARNPGGLPADPVARFHLGNGASAHQLNWPADLSPKALRSAHGLMINYLYELPEIEHRHEAYVRDGRIAHGAQLAAALERQKNGETLADHP